MTDQIKKTVDLNAPVSRVWRALTDAREFGAWFGITFDGAFVAGESRKGIIPFHGREIVAELWIDRIDQKAGVFSYRWHPFALDPDVDYSKEPLTTVEFTLTETPNGSHLVITESGFDALPEARRAPSFAANGQGWTIQAERIAKYVQS